MPSGGSQQSSSQPAQVASDTRFFLTKPPVNESPPLRRPLTSTLTEEEAKSLLNLRNSPPVPESPPKQNSSARLKPSTDIELTATPETKPPQTKPIEPKDILNYGSRWLEVKQFSGGFGQGAFDARDLVNRRRDADTTWQENDLQAGSLIGNGAGLLVGIIGHLLCVRYGWYYTNGALNPFYRNFKTLANVGWSVGTFITMMLPLPNPVKKFLAPIVADVASLVIGLFAVPYILYRRGKINPRENETLLITGTEGWSKFGKTSYVTGTFLGPLISAICAPDSMMKPANDSRKNEVSLLTSIAGIGTFVFGMTVVPLANKVGKLFGRQKPLLLQAKRIKKEETPDSEPLTMENSDPDKDQFRNNYIRSFMQFGNSVGIFVAAAFGAYLFPLWAPAMAMLVCGGACAVLLGIIGGFKGHKISAYVKKHWTHPDDKDPENSVDYVMRSGSYILGTVGTIFGIAFGNMWMGTAIGGMIGWFASLITVWLPRKYVPIEEKSTCLPWTQRTGSGSMVGSVVGGILGFGLGLVVGGPFAEIAVFLFTAIGSTLGTIIAGLYGKETRNVISKMIEPERLPEEKPRLSTSCVFNTLRKTSLTYSPSRSMLVTKSMTEEPAASKPVASLPTTTTPPAPVIEPIITLKKEALSPDEKRRTPAPSPVNNSQGEKKTTCTGNTAATVTRASLVSSSFLANMTPTRRQSFPTSHNPSLQTMRQSTCVR